MTSDRLLTRLFSPDDLRMLLIAIPLAGFLGLIGFGVMVMWKLQDLALIPKQILSRLRQELTHPWDV